MYVGGEDVGEGVGVPAKIIVYMYMYKSEEVGHDISLHNNHMTMCEFRFILKCHETTKRQGKTKPHPAVL